MHRAHRCFQRRATCVAVSFAGLQKRLFANNAFAMNFLQLVVGIKNEPVTRNQLDAQLAFIFNRYKVSECVLVVINIRVIGDKLALHGYVDIVFLLCCHCLIFLLPVSYD